MSSDFLQVGHDSEMIVKSERDYVLMLTSGSEIYFHVINLGNGSFCCFQHASLSHVMGMWIELDLSLTYTEREREHSTLC